MLSLRYMHKYDKEYKTTKRKSLSRCHVLLGTCTARGSAHADVQGV